MICPKCKHQRTATDDPLIPDYQCPACGIVYAKFKSPNSISSSISENIRQTKLQMKLAESITNERTRHAPPPNDDTLNHQKPTNDEYLLKLQFSNKLKLFVASVVVLFIGGLIWVVIAKTKQIEVSENKPEVTYNCTLNGRGDVSCTFKNSGKAKGGLCVYAALHPEKNFSATIDLFKILAGSDTLEQNIIYKNKLLDLYAEKLNLSKDEINVFWKDVLKHREYLYMLNSGTRAFGSIDICSGIVEPDDIRQVTGFVEFNSWSPYDACQGGSSSGGWTASCSVYFITQEEVISMLKATVL